MSKYINANKLTFIEFLKQEFGIKSAIFLAKTEDQKQIEVIKNQKNHRFKWFLEKKPRNLANVLEIKMDDIKDNEKRNSSDIDLEDKSVLHWSDKYYSHQKHLIQKKNKKRQNDESFFVKFFSQPYFNIPGVFSYCRENDNTSEPLNWLNKSVIFVFAVFIVAVVSSSYLVNKNSNLSSNNLDLKNQQQINIKPSRDVLANYIRKNDNWLESQFDNTKVISITAEDLLGQVAGAAETENDVLPADREPKAGEIIKSKYNAFLDKLFIYFKGIKNEQKDASFFLSNTLANIVSR